MTTPESQLDADLRDLTAMVDHRPGDLPLFLAEVHAADLAAWMQAAATTQRLVAFGALSAEERAELFAFTSDDVTQDLVDELGVEELVAVVEHMGADDVVDLLAFADDEVAEKVLGLVDYERAHGLRRLAAYDADSAGGLMTTEFATVPEGAHIGDAIKALRREDERTAEEEAGIFVVDGADRPVGWVSDRDLVTTPIHTDVEEVMAEIPVTVHPAVDQEEAALAVHKYGLQALAVTNTVGALVGVITAEDAADVFEEEAEEDIRRLVGTSTEEQTYLPVLVRVRQRLPLQVLTVLGGLVTAFLLRMAMPGGADAANTNTDLLRYIPIIIGLAGNVGIQASTILVRAFATGEVEPDREASVLGSETLVGLVIGILCGLATGVAVALGEGELRFALAIGVAIASAVTLAAFLGCGVPMICRRIGIDPAVVAGPFLITVSDISGTGLYLAVARMIVGV